MPQNAFDKLYGNDMQMIKEYMEIFIPRTPLARSLSQPISSTDQMSVVMVTTGLAWG